MSYPFSHRSIIWLIIIAGCISCTNPLRQSQINFNDTLYSTQLFSVNGADTIRKHVKTYYKAVDTAVVKSEFYYTVSKDYGNINATYKVYFNRDSVIAFCDSMLKALPPKPENSFDYYFNERVFYKEILEQAIKNDMGTTEMTEELDILLTRLKPFIINESTGDKPSYTIVTYNFSTRNGSKIEEDRTHVFKAHNGDTIHLSFTTLQTRGIDTTGHY
ncbi:MAG TPA: hypothetical protein VD794_04835 [Flavisolibacter sp.]|nr:hypothetical protein [Flavisolibacter sp.]